MPDIKEQFLKSHLKKTIPDIKPGDRVKVHQKIKETTSKGEERERTQVFEGVVLAKKHGKGINSTITVRKSISGVGVERIFPVHSPAIEKIEIVGRAKTRRSKLYYLRKRSRRKARLKRKPLPESPMIQLVEDDELEEPEEKKPEEKPEEPEKPEEEEKKEEPEEQSNEEEEKPKDDKEQEESREEEDKKE